jgi:hypothetical protein
MSFGGQLVEVEEEAEEAMACRDFSVYGHFYNTISTAECGADLRSEQ